MNKILPKISVVCPTYNSRKFVEKTLLTVLKQKVLPFELIISDDGSHDNTLSVVEDIIRKNNTTIPIIILNNTHHGPGATRNTGIRFARGDWIAFLDSDDLWHEQKIERVSEIIFNNPEFNFICHNEEYKRFDGSKILLDYGKSYKPTINLSKQLFRFNLFSTSAVTCKKSLFFQHGFFDETLMSAQDYELWLRLSPYIKPYFLANLLGWYIDRQGNISSQKNFKKLKNVIRALSINQGLISQPLYVKSVVRHIAAYVKQEFISVIK